MRSSRLDAATRRSNGVRGILFDKDGTLVDFNATWVPAHRHAAQALCAEAGLDRAASLRLLAAGGYDAATGRCLAGSLLALCDQVVASVVELPALLERP